MTAMDRVLAVLAYLLPVVSWAYIYFAARSNQLAVYHMRQAIGLFAFLAAAVIVWGAVAWVLAAIPFMAVVGMALFALVIVAYLYGAVAWLWGMVNALSNRMVALPIFGKWANRLPIR